MMKERLIRYEDLIPCKAAFIDAKTPGSNLKDNYSIIGGGVSESIHQKVNLSCKVFKTMHVCQLLFLRKMSVLLC